MKLLQILFLLVIVPFNLLLANNISFDALQEDDYVYYGQGLLARLILKTDKEISPTPQPKIIQNNSSENYSIEMSQQPRVNRSSFVQIINGKRTTESNISYAWDIQITPTSTNSIDTIKFEIDVDGKNYKAQLKPITVISPQPSQFANIELSVDKTNVIAEDTFRITASLRLAAIANKGKQYPPIYQRAIPNLFLPHLDKQQEEITLVANGPNELAEYATLDIGMYINSYRIPSAFGFFSNSSKSIFNLPNSIITENGTNFFVYSWTTIYKAKKPASITFDPITFIGQILIPDANEQFNLTDVYIVSEPITITISEPPLEGRPDSFIGAISDKLKAETRLDTQSCKEGDPINLTLSIENVENPLAIIPPNLTKISGFSENFRAFGETKATPNEAEKKVTFEYSIRPLVSGTIEFPSIELGYYNLSTNQYQTIITSPLPIRVDPAPQVAAFEGIQSQEEYIEDEIIQYYPTAISLDSATTASTTANNTIIKLAILAPFICLSALFVKLLFKYRKQIIDRTRNMSVGAKAIKALNNAQTPQEIMAAVTSLIKQKFKPKTSSFTPSEIIKLLEEHNVASEIVNELSLTLNRIFNLSFSPNADIPHEVSIAKEKLIPCMQKLKGKNKTLPQILFALLSILSATFMIIVPIFLAIQLASSYKGEQKIVTPTEFEVREANILFNNAISKENFSNVATNYYTKLSFEHGSYQPAILHNYATALTLAGYPQKAIDVLEYTETLTGANSQLDNSMLFALQEQTKLDSTDPQSAIISEEPTLGWYRVPLFWHYNYSISQRANALCIVWVAFWCVLMLRLFIQKRKALNLCMAVCSFVFILTFSSYIISQEKLKKPIPEITVEELLIEQESSNEEAN